MRPPLRPARQVDDVEGLVRRKGVEEQKGEVLAPHRLVQRDLLGVEGRLAREDAGEEEAGGFPGPAPSSAERPGAARPGERGAGLTSPPR